ncbi:MAG: EAL domain-containing protein [Acaryochloris sp. RU_4_1]|nr:EAL domain-containing protein [Acaryochloris sp. RU_4_1]
MGNQTTPMTPMLKGRWPRLMALTGAGFSLLVGLVVILAWHLHLIDLIQIPPDSPPIRYNTALALLLSGLALTALLKNRRHWAMIPSGLVVLIGAGTWVQYLFRIDLGIDQLFIQDYITQQLHAADHAPVDLVSGSIQQFFISLEHPFPGRPSPNAALGLTLTGTALLCLSGITGKGAPQWSAAQNRGRAIATTCAAGSIAIGTTALLGYITQLGTAYTWRYLTGVSVPTAISLLLMGMALMMVSLTERPVNQPLKWFPFSIGFGVLMALLLLWQALISWSYSLLNQLPSLAREVQALILPTAHMILLLGSLLVILVVSVLYFAQDIQAQSATTKQLHRDLGQTHAVLKAAMEATADGLLILDAEGRRLHYNLQFLQIWGFSDPRPIQLENRGNEPGVPAFMLDQLQDPQAFLAATQRMIDNLESETFDVFFLKDGRVLERYTCPYWMSDRPMGKVLSYRDVTERYRAEERLEASEARFHAFMNHSPAVAFMKDDQGRYVYANQTLEEIFQVPFEFLQGKTDFDWLPAEVAATVHENDQAILATDQTSTYLETVPSPEGRVYHWLTFKFPFQDPLGQRYVGGVAIDMTERQEMEEALFQEKELAQVTLDSIGDAVITTDAMGRIQYLNPVAEALTGWSEEEAQGLSITTVFQIFHEETDQVVTNPVEKALQTGQIEGLADHTVLIARDGRRIGINDSAAPIRDRNRQVVGAVMVFQDVTQARNLSRQVSWQAMHDSLTGLVNRQEFEQRVTQALDVAILENQSHGLCYLDLDQFKHVNDTLGHPTGDKLLKMVADRLQLIVRGMDTVARMGGDEFALVLADTAHPSDVDAVAKRIIDVVSEPYEINGRQVIIGTSVGIAIGRTSRGLLPDQLIRNADVALYTAKREGRGTFSLFKPEMDALVKARGALEYDLRKALPAGQFELHYQPLINLANNGISGFEALIRWRHPEKGLVQPGMFVPLAEEIGLIVPIGEWVVREACRMAAQWPGSLKVAVNISPAHFCDTALVQTVVDALAASGLAPNRLELEITETNLLQNSVATLSALHQLRDIGVRIAMDDFGTGYSSLSYLQSFPFDKIKIDRSFVEKIAEDANSLNIVRAVAALAKGLGMASTAEGVETKEQLAKIKAEGYTEIQGYLVSRPVPAQEVATLLRSRYAQPRAA